MPRRDSPSSIRQMSSTCSRAWAEGVLLDSVEPVDFVNDQEERVPCVASHNLTQLRYARRDGSHILHLLAQLHRQQSRKCRLSTPWRTPDDRTERYVIADKLPKWCARSCNCNLTHEIVQIRRFKPLEHALSVFHESGYSTAGGSTQRGCSGLRHPRHIP